MVCSSLIAHSHLDIYTFLETTVGFCFHEPRHGIAEDAPDKEKRERKRNGNAGTSARYRNSGTSSPRRGQRTSIWLMILILRNLRGAKLLGCKMSPDQDQRRQSPTRTHIQNHACISPTDRSIHKKIPSNPIHPIFSFPHTDPLSPIPNNPNSQSAQATKVEAVAASYLKVGGSCCFLM